MEGTKEKQATPATRSGVVPGADATVNILEVLKMLRRGRTVGDLQDKLQELVAAVRETTRKGKLVFEMSVECRVPGDANTVEIKDKVRVDIPQPLREPTIMYTTDRNYLQRKDPRQGTLEGIDD